MHIPIELKRCKCRLGNTVLKCILELHLQTSCQDSELLLQGCVGLIPGQGTKIPYATWQAPSKMHPLGTCLCIAESLHCSPETITTLLIDYDSEKLKQLSRVLLFVTPRTIQSMEFSWPKHQSGQPYPSPGDLPKPGIKPRSPMLQVDSLPTELSGIYPNTKLKVFKKIKFRYQEKMHSCSCNSIKAWVNQAFCRQN